LCTPTLGSDTGSQTPKTDVKVKVSFALRKNVKVIHLKVRTLRLLYEIPIGAWCSFTFLHSYRASWYYQSLLFTNECTSDCLKNNIKINIKIAPTCFGVVTPSPGSALPVLAEINDKNPLYELAQ
jgi:hypothetical protein